MYFASNKAIAEHYRKTLAGRTKYGVTQADSAHMAAAEDFRNNGYDRDRAMEGMRKAYPGASDAELVSAWEQSDPGNLYRVEVPEDSGLLDWDKPLAEQPEKVRMALSTEGIVAKELHPEPRDDGDYWVLVDNDGNRFGQNAYYDRREAIDDLPDTGREVYQALSRKLGGAEAASIRLNEIGIPGLRYLDGGSRLLGGGSHNYVIWDEAAIGEPETLTHKSVI